MDDIRMFAKTEKELETLIHAVRIYCQDVGTKSGREKCAMLIMKNSKWHPTDGTELLNQEKIRTFGEKETYKRILEIDTIKRGKI